MPQDDQKSRQPLDDWLEALIRRWMSGFKTKLLAGLAIIAPLWITGWALLTIFKWAEGFSSPLLQGTLGVHIPGLGFMITFVFLWFCGVFATNVLGRRLIQIGHRVLQRLPVIRAIHGPIQQLLETLTSPGKTNFKRVVLIEYPRQGMWTLGFVGGNVQRRSSNGTAHSVFIPTSPNPTSGYMLIVPSEFIRTTNLSVEEAFQMIVSGGIVIPPSLRLDDTPPTPPLTVP